MQISPQKFGRYLLVDKIASGGMAEIFKAKLIGVEGFEKTVVIKRIHPFWSERRDFISMLVDEAKILVHLNHPNIVQVFELGKEGPTYFIAMEYVDGIDLRQLLAKLKSSEKALPQAIAIRIVIEALRGLFYAHQRSLKEHGFLGIVHRDISPQNILVSFDGEVKVTDFGIAKALTQTHETQTGVLKGKYAYMSPEQALGTSLDSRSDLFSCGIVLFELLFHRRLFAGKNDIETLDNVRYAKIVWPEEKLQSLYPGIQPILQRALSAQPEDRYLSAEEFADALENLLPSQEKISRRQLAEFIQSDFMEEVQRRRLYDSEVSYRTKSFIRQTKISPLDSENTVSIVETASVLEPTPVTSALESDQRVLDVNDEKTFHGRQLHHAFRKGAHTVRKRMKSCGKWIRLIKTGFVSAELGKKGQAWLQQKWIYAIGGIFGAFLLIFAIQQKEIFSSKTPEPIQPEIGLEKNIQQQQIASLLVTPVSFPTEPKAAPIAAPQLMGSLLLKAIPLEANIQIAYSGAQATGRGEVYAKDIPMGSLVKTHVVLEGYEPVNKSFEILSDNLEQQYVFKLKKKSPIFGTILINAVPWGVVRVPGFINNSETPVSQTRIPEGSYRVIVSHPPLKKTLSASAAIRGGRTTRCHADFEGVGSIRCQ